MSMTKTVSQPATALQEIDKWIYAFMAGLILLICLVAFFPTSIQLLDDIATGVRPPVPFILHVHAAAMVAWLLLLFAQTLLMATGRRQLHRSLGLAAFVVAPVLLIGLIGVASWRVGLGATLSPELYPALSAQLQQGGPNVLLINTVSIVFFTTFFLWAISVRRRDTETHKRMMLLATIVLMSPAFGRLVAVNPILPDFGLNGADARHLYELFLLTPMLVYDFIRRGSPHRAYWYGLALMLPCMLIAHFLWSSPWWLEFAPRLVSLG